MSDFSNQPNRLDNGGMIDRAKMVEFTFDGKKYDGSKGQSK